MPPDLMERFATALKRSDLDQTQAARVLGGKPLGP